MSDIVRQLWRDHRNMRRLLNVLEWQTRLLQTDQLADLALMEDALDYMIRYADDYHHVREDALFDALAGRDDACRAAAERLRRDHARLARQSGSLYDTIQRVARDDVTPRDRLTDATRDYLAAQRAHMQDEESALFVRAAQLLTEADCAAIDAALGERDDPLFGPDVAERYRQRYAQLVGSGE